MDQPRPAWLSPPLFATLMGGPCLSSPWTHEAYGFMKHLPIEASGNSSGLDAPI